jgi:hypothetical protein
MQVETKFLRVFQAVELGDNMDGWRVCWLGGWDKYRVLFVVMIKRVTACPTAHEHNLGRHAKLSPRERTWANCGATAANPQRCRSRLRSSSS